MRSADVAARKPEIFDVFGVQTAIGDLGKIDAEGAVQRTLAAGIDALSVLIVLAGG